MANVSGGKKIKGNIIGKTKPIKANVIQNKNTIKANITNSPSATEEHKGLIRIATEQEAIEGVSTNTAITPHTLKNIVTSDKYFVFEQGIASDTWVIEHNLGKKPSITVVDSADTVIGIYKADYSGENKVTLNFNGAFTGKAYLN